MNADPDVRRLAQMLRRAMTLPEVLLWREIKGRRLSGLHFRKQHPFGPYVLDFYCDKAKLAVEGDGWGHNMWEQPKRDERRDRYLAGLGVRTIRFAATDVLRNMEEVLNTIQAAALQRCSPAGGAVGGAD